MHPIYIDTVTINRQQKDNNCKHTVQTVHIIYG